MLRIVAVACVALLSAACLQAQETSAPADPSKGSDRPRFRGPRQDRTSPVVADGRIMIFRGADANPTSAPNSSAAT